MWVQEEHNAAAPLSIAGSDRLRLTDGNAHYSPDGHIKRPRHDADTDQPVAVVPQKRITVDDRPRKLMGHAYKYGR